VVSAFCKVSGGAVHVKNIALQVDFDIIIGGGGEEAHGVVWGDCCDCGVCGFYFFWRGLVVFVVALDVCIKEGLKEGEDLVGDTGRGGGHCLLLCLLLWVLLYAIYGARIAFSFFLVLVLFLDRHIIMHYLLLDA
jgi:hypothetical protein